MSYSEWNNNKFLAKDIPCKRDCADRAIGCHETCESYIKWKEERKKRASEQEREKAIRSEAIEQIKKAFGKRNRK